MLNKSRYSSLLHIFGKVKLNELKLSDFCQKYTSIIPVQFIYILYSVPND